MVTTRKKTSKGKPPSKTASLDRSESSSAKSSKQKKKKPAAAKTDATQDVSAKTIKKKADSVDETQMEGAGGGGGPKHYRQEPTKA
uniref:Uncharacterized protein n=1 Tax=Panagrolaimus davidi TaxID=227884 RepID=A0A914QXG9_9BILA